MSTLRNQENDFKSCSLWCAGFSYWITFSLSEIGPLKDEIMITSLFLGLSHTPSTPHLSCHSPHLTPYRNSSLLESPSHLFVAFKLVFFFSALGEMGKGSMVMWQMEGAQGITSVKILLNKSFFPPNLSMFHSHWGFCNLEISKIYRTYLLSAIFLSLSFLVPCWLLISEIQIGKEYAVGI